jgi:DNA-binding transcriptional LysR family regulator
MARHVIHNLRTLEENITSLTSGTNGLVRIGVQSIAAQPMMVRAIADVRRNSPGIRFQLIELGIDELLRNIRDNKLDFGVARIVPPMLGTDIDHLVIIHEPHVAVASNNHNLVSKKNGALEWNSVLQEDWCLPLPGTPIRDKFVGALMERKLPLPSSIIESNSLVTNLMLHQRMDLISLAQKGVAQQWANSGYIRILPLCLGLDISPMGLLWSNQFILPPAAVLYRSALEAALESATETYSEVLWPDVAL